MTRANSASLNKLKAAIEESERQAHQQAEDCRQRIELMKGEADMYLFYVSEKNKPMMEQAVALIHGRLDMIEENMKLANSCYGVVRRMHQMIMDGMDLEEQAIAATLQSGANTVQKSEELFAMVKDYLLFASSILYL